MLAENIVKWLLKNNTIVLHATCYKIKVALLQHENFAIKSAQENIKSASCETNTLALHMIGWNIKSGVVFVYFKFAFYTMKLSYRHTIVMFTLHFFISYRVFYNFQCESWFNYPINTIMVKIIWHFPVEWRDHEIW